MKQPPPGASHPPKSDAPASGGRQLRPVQLGGRPHRHRRGSQPARNPSQPEGMFHCLRSAFTCQVGEVEIATLEGLAHVSGTGDHL
jgi:hypothetical protein